MLRADLFLGAQAAMYDQALRELKAEKKQSHWIWFVFPQLRALGHSEKAKLFGLDDVPTALEYADHPILGDRLRECTLLMVQTPLNASEILGPIDAMKFRSCMTLMYAAKGWPMFRTAATIHFDHPWCPSTELWLDGHVIPEGPDAR